MNTITIILVKIREVYQGCVKCRKLDRLRKISEIEQKYLFFDYKKFFTDSKLNKLLERETEVSRNVYGREIVEVKPTEVYRE